MGRIITQAASILPNFSNPNKFQKHSVENDFLECRIDVGTAVQATSTTYNTQIATIGTSGNTAFTANTYQTIATLTGSGYVSHIVGPSYIGGSAPTTTFEITVDGTVYTIALLHGITDNTYGVRALLGHMIPASASELASFRLASTQDSMIHNGSYSGGYVFSHGVDTALRMGIPILKFNTSCTVKIKISQNVTTTSYNEQACNVAWMYQL